MDSTTYCASLQNCPDLDPSSSTDSLQTHDSLVTPESPHYLPSPIESLKEGTTQGQGVTQVRANDSAIQDVTYITEVTQVRTDDSLAYDSLITALSWLSLEPDPDPLSDHQRSLLDLITTPHPLRPDLDPTGSPSDIMTHLDGTYTQV